MWKHCFLRLPFARCDIFFCLWSCRVLWGKKMASVQFSSVCHVCWRFAYSVRSHLCCGSDIHIPHFRSSFILSVHIFGCLHFTSIPFAFDVAVQHFSWQHDYVNLFTCRYSRPSSLGFVTYCFCLLESTFMVFVSESLHSFISPQNGNKNWIETGLN